MRRRHAWKAGLLLTSVAAAAGCGRSLVSTSVVTYATCPVPLVADPTHDAANPERVERSLDEYRVGDGREGAASRDRSTDERVVFVESRDGGAMYWNNTDGGLHDLDGGTWVRWDTLDAGRRALALRDVDRQVDMTLAFCRSQWTFAQGWDCNDGGIPSSKGARTVDDARWNDRQRLIGYLRQNASKDGCSAAAAYDLAILTERAPLAGQSKKWRYLALAILLASSREQQLDFIRGALSVEIVPGPLKEAGVTSSDAPDAGALHAAFHDDEHPERFVGLLRIALARSLVGNGIVPDAAPFLGAAIQEKP